MNNHNRNVISSVVSVMVSTIKKTIITKNQTINRHSPSYKHGELATSSADVDNWSVGV